MQWEHFDFSLCLAFFSHLLQFFYSLLLGYSDGCCLGQCLHHTKHNKISLLSQNTATPTGTRVESRTADFTHMLLSQRLSGGIISVWLKNYVRTGTFELTCFLKYLDLTGHRRLFPNCGPFQAYPASAASLQTGMRSIRQGIWMKSQSKFILNKNIFRLFFRIKNQNKPTKKPPKESKPQRNIPTTDS